MLLVDARGPAEFHGFEGNVRRLGHIPGADPLKRHYFQKYVLGILCRGLSEEEKQQRVLEALRRRRARSTEVDR